MKEYPCSLKATPFEPGVPQDKIQDAVETQLKDDKWVVIEKKDGTSELLTKGDLPKPEEKSGGGAGPGDPKAPEKPVEDDWRSVFSAVPVKPKPEPKPELKPDPKSEDATTKPVTKPVCVAGPKKETEKWESKFKNVKSATATHKGKGG
jgi:hypothetical protein